MTVFTRYYYLSCRLKILVCHSLRWLSFLSMVVLGRESFAKFVIGESGGGRRVRNCIRVLLVPSPDPTPNAGTPDYSGRSREWKVDPRKSPSRPCGISIRDWREVRDPSRASTRSCASGLVSNSNGLHNHSSRRGIGSVTVIQADGERSF